MLNRNESCLSVWYVEGYKLLIYLFKYTLFATLAPNILASTVSAFYYMVQDTRGDVSITYMDIGILTAFHFLKHGQNLMDTGGSLWLT